MTALTQRPKTPITVAMTVLKNIRHEKFAQLVASGKPSSVSYGIAQRGDGSAVTESDRVGAAKWLRIASVADRIKELREAVSEKAEWTIADAITEFLQIASADVNELIGTRIGACRFCHGDNHLYQWKEREFLEACQRAEAADPPEPLPDIAGGFGYRRTAAPHPSCPECEGEGVMRVVPQDSRNLSPAAKMIYEGVKKTRDGFEIKIADRHKARENAARILGAFVDRKEVSGPGGAPIQHEVPSLEQLIDEARRLGIPTEVFSGLGSPSPSGGAGT
jgi:phage terminase small subunit